jgi:hypothetical protein
MNHMFALPKLLIVALFGMLFIAPANAQATRTWVSGVGDDANPCSRTAPCKTWAGAISKTAAGGEINAIDPGGFGAVTITKAITLDGGGGIIASVLVSGTNGINVAAGANDVVTIRNIQINGAGTGLNGINYTSGAMLNVEHCSIFSFTQAGINIATSAGAIMNVVDTTITNAANGIRFAPTGGSATGQADGTTLQKISGSGITANGAANFSVNNSRILSTGTAVTATAGSIVNVDSSAIANNTTAFSNTSSFIRVTRNTIMNNGNNFANSGGTIASAGNNMVAVNGAGVPNGTVTQQ